ncbi:MAG: carboxypeptidase regulatory-like domain-containing protein [Balneolaceae bacterium]
MSGITANAQPTDATLRVIVISEDEGTPVTGANILLTIPEGDTLRAGVSDIDGFYEFSGIPPGNYQIHISYIGFETQRETITLEESETRIHRSELVTSVSELDELVIGVIRGAVRREAGMQTITSVDLDRIPTPGPGGDLTVYLQTLPGVVTSGDRGGEMYIRGGTPAQNLMLVDKMPVIKPFHISNLFSAFPQEIISSVDMYAGGFGAEYASATSSVLDVSLRQGNMRNFQSQAAVSPYMSSFQAEGPLTTDKASLLVMGRYSTIEQAAPPLTGKEVPLLFHDMTARLSINWEGITCSVTGLNTFDRGKINPQREVRLSWSNTTIGTRCLGYAEELRHAVDFTIGYSGYQSSETGIDNTGRSAGVQMGFLRMDNGGDLFGTPVNYGFQWILTRYNAQLDDPFSEIRNSGVRFADLGSSLEIFTSVFSGYLSTNWQPREDLTITPGLTTQIRQSYLAPTVEPRLRVTWSPGGSDRQEVSLAAGRYFQMMDGITDERDAGTVFYVYKPVDEGDPLPESLHAILGYRSDLSRNLTANLEGYAKKHKNIPVAEWTREPGNTIRTAQADGFTYGLDLQFEADLNSFYFSLGYGWSQVTYEALSEDLVAWVDEPVFRYHPSHDRRHQLNLLSSYHIAGFTFNASWRFNSGAPFTQIFAYDMILNVPKQHPLADRGRIVTLYSEPFDGRMPSFHRLDVSVDRSFQILPGLELEAELGAINAYNIRNVFYFDVNTLQQVDQMPLLPYMSIGARFN